MAANITVVAGIVAQDYQGAETEPRLRIFVSETFTASDSQVVLRSSFEQGEFYDEHTCFVDGSNQVNYPQFLIHSTGDAISNPDNARYTFCLFTADGRFIQVIATSIVIPATPTTTSLPVLEALVDGPPPPPPSDPDLYVTQAQLSAAIASVLLTQATEPEAIAGVNSSHYMTPERTAQEIAALVTNFAFATEAQAIAGTSDSVMMSPLRTAQEIAALVTSFTFATQAQAEAGTNASVMMSPLRTFEAIAVHILDAAYSGSWNADTTHTASRNAIYDKIEAVIAYADGLVTGLLDDRGNYDASTNLFPATGGSGAAGAIKKGDLWTIQAGGGGTLGGVPVETGDVVRSLTDTPGQTAGNWAITEHNFSYVPENQANKSSSIAGDTGSTTKYPSVAAVEAHTAGKVSDAVYDATNWNGVTDVAPSKNAVRDKFESLVIPVVSDVAYDATTWNGNTDAPTKNAVRDKIESLSFAATLNDLTDVTITSPTTGDIVKYVGGQFINAPENEGLGSSAPAGVLAGRRTANAMDDEFDANALDTGKWTRTLTAGPVESYDDLIRSGILCRFTNAGGSEGISLSQAFVPGSADFSVTVCGMLQLKANFNAFFIQVDDAGSTNQLHMEYVFGSSRKITYWKNVGGVQTFDIVVHAPASTDNDPPTVPTAFLMLHIQRVAGTYSLWYSYDGVHWSALQTAHAQTITVAKVIIGLAQGGASNKIYGVLHWFRKDAYFHS